MIDKSPRTALQARRLAAHAMNIIAREMTLGAMAVVWQGDKDDQWLVDNPEELYAMQRKKTVAHIFLSSDQAQVFIPNAFDMVRPEHQLEFNPEEHDVVIQTALDWRGRKVHNDIEAEIPLENVLGLDLPKQPIPSATICSTIKAIKSRR